MAKSTKKSKNKKGKTAQTTSQQMSKKGYFESGRLTNLPLDNSFLATIKQGDYPYLYAAFTRRHINGNLSFAIFGIADQEGDVMEVIYDFNKTQEEFDEFRTLIKLEAFSDREALQQLMYDTVLTARSMGVKFPAEFHIARQIFSVNLEVWQEVSGKKLAVFQNRTAVYDSTTEEAKTGDKQAAADFAPYTTAVYNPDTVSHWDRTSWKDFLEKMEFFTPNDFYEKGFTPIGYLFEKTMLQDYPVTGGLQKVFDRLATALPPISTKRNTGTYQPGAYETLIENALWQRVHRPLGTPDDQMTLTLLRDAIHQYPDNPELSSSLQDFFKYTDQPEALFQLARSNYEKYPLMDFAFIGYFTTIIKQKRKPLINDFFAKGYLIEDHYPEGFEFFDRHFQFYYLMMGDYFASVKDYGALWALHKCICKTALFQQSELFQKSWQDLLIKPVVLMATRLVENSEEQNEAVIDRVLNN